MLSQLKIGQKLFLLIGVCFVAPYGFVLLKERGVVRSYQRIIQTDVAAQRLVLSAEVRFKLQVQEWKNILLRGYKRDALAKHSKSFDALATEVAATVDSLTPLLHDSTSKRLALQFKEQHEALNVNYRKARDVFAAGEGLDAAGADDAVNGKDKPPTAALDSLADHLGAESTRILAEQDAAVVSGYIVMAIFLIAIVATLILVRRLTKPLVQLAVVADAIAQGDLSQQVTYESGDEIGRVATAFRECLIYMHSIAASAERVAQGDLDIQVKPRSDKDALAQSFGRLTGNLDRLLQESTMLVNAAQEGRLSVRGDASKFSGGFNRLLSGINATLDATVAPQKDASVALRKLASGDLCVRMQGVYKGDFTVVGDAFNEAAQAMQRVITEVRAAAEEVTSASNQIATSSNSLATQAQQQASTIEEISASLHETGGTAERSAESAVIARNLAESTHLVTEQGVQGMNALSVAMSQIERSSRDTAKILKTIDEIAFQTNLLALNAAVEAARAGDAGRGFAVVAEEVRNLAIRSAEAAKSTATLIDQSIMSVGQGVALSLDVKQKLEEIDTSVKRVHEMMVSMTMTSQDQSRGVGQVVTVIDSLSGSTMNISANSEEAAATSHELASQAASLLEAVSRFTSDASSGPLTSATSANRPLGRRREEVLA